MRSAVPAERLARPLAAGLVLAALLMPVTACTSGSSAAAPSATAVTAAPTSVATTRTSNGAPVAPTSSGPATTPSSSSSSSPAGTSSSPPSAAPRPTALAPVPSATRSTLPPAPLASGTPVGSGVQVSLVRASAVTMAGTGVGEVQGPGVAVTLRLTNRTGKALALTSSLVSATYGSDATPGAPSTGEPASPWPASVAAGSAVQGTFVFAIPTEERADVTLAVSSAPTSAVILLRGPLPR